MAFGPTPPGLQSEAVRLSLHTTPTPTGPSVSAAVQPDASSLLASEDAVVGPASQPDQERDERLAE